MSVGLDLAPHYFMFLGDYIKENPNTPFGQPGRFQVKIITIGRF